MVSFRSQKIGKLSKVSLDSIENISYSAIMKALRNKDVKINGKRVNKDVEIKVGDMVELYVTIVSGDNLVSHEIIFEDQNLLVVNKKSGFTSETVFENISKHCKNAKFIHRLDRNTCGLMVFALNDCAETELLAGFKNRDFDKYYLTLVKGKPSKNEAILEDYLLKDKDKSKVSIFDSFVKGSVKIKTGYKVIENRGETSLLEVRLYTGKTHQIRAHLAYKGLPIVGDGKYGDNAFNRQMGVKIQKLCAYKLVLNFNENQQLYYLNGKQFVIKIEF